MTDNDPSELIRLTAMDMGLAEFLIMQVVQEDIRYCSYKLRRGEFFSQVMKNKRKDLAAELFN